MHNKKIKDIEIQLPKLEKKEIEFTKERDIAQKAEDSRDLLSQYERAKAKKEILEASSTGLLLPPKTSEHLIVDDFGEELPIIVLSSICCFVKDKS